MYRYAILTTLLSLPKSPESFLQTASCVNGEARLLVGEGDAFYLDETDYDPQYYIEAGLRVGRVEICTGGRYGTICDSFWGDEEASVLCKQLGYSPYGKMLHARLYTARS